jgi:hypothetical protein
VAPPLPAARGPARRSCPVRQTRLLLHRLSALTPIAATPVIPVAAVVQPVSKRGCPDRNPGTPVRHNHQSSTATPHPGTHLSRPPDASRRKRVPVPRNSGSDAPSASVRRA